jgi:hypothetical protein
VPDNYVAGRRKHVALPRATGAVLAALVATASTGGWSAQNASAATTTTRARGSSAPRSAHSTPTTATTVAHVHKSSVQTILSPIGLNIRAKPSKSARVLVIAARGDALDRLAYTSRAGGWYEVHGPGVTGWISSDPTYSAPGRFGTYESPSFSVLFPAGWSASGSASKGVTFQSPAKEEKVVITEAASVGSLPSITQGNGVSEQSSLQVTACGVTAHLGTYSASGAGRDLAGVAFTINAQHALGINATLTSPSQLRTVLNFVNSVAFPFKVCVGG